MDKSKLTSIERDLVEGLGAFLEDLKSNQDIPDKYTCRRVVLNLSPKHYTAAEVKSTRRMLGMSQSLFAKFLGVSPKTVCAWEQGKRPSEIASRFMDEIQHNPEYYRQRVKESVTMRQSETASRSS